MKLVTVDFDNTLTRPNVQSYIKSLIDQGIIVWIVTSRFDDLHIHCWEGTSFAYCKSNEDVYRIASEVGIPLHHIRFCNMQPKHEFLFDTKTLFHLDDDDVELPWLGDIGVDVKKDDWLENCNKLIG